MEDSNACKYKNSSMVFRLIVNLRFVMMAIVNNRTVANKRRKAIIVTGSSSSRRFLVATKEVPQNITANSISRYLNVFDLYNDNGGR